MERPRRHAPRDFPSLLRILFRTMCVSCSLFSIHGSIEDEFCELPFSVNVAVFLFNEKNRRSELELRGINDHLSQALCSKSLKKQPSLGNRLSKLLKRSGENVQRFKEIVKFRRREKNHPSYLSNKSKQPGNLILSNKILNLEKNLFAKPNSI